MANKWRYSTGGCVAKGVGGKKRIFVEIDEHYALCSVTVMLLGLLLGCVAVIVSISHVIVF